MLTELLGTERRMTSITKQDAQNVKRVLLELPANRNKMPLTRNLPLLEAVKVQDVQKITTVMQWLRRARWLTVSRSST